MVAILKRFADLTPVAWANGAGATTELVSFDESTSLTPDAARWRLSVADLTGPTMFSRLDAVHRTFLPVDAAVTLLIDGDDRHVEPGQTTEFAGDAAVMLSALSAPSRAVNLMVMVGVDGLPPRLTRVVSGVDAAVAIALAPNDRYGAFDLIAPSPDGTYANSQFAYVTVAR